MTDKIVPFSGSGSERERRTALAKVEAVLGRCDRDDLTWEYRLIRPSAGQPDLAYTGLVVTCPGVAGEARVVAVSLVRHLLSTRPGGAPGEPKTSIEPVLELLRQQLRGFGIAGVAGLETRYEPLPGAGLPAYEVTILAPPPHGADGQAVAGLDAEGLLPMEHRTSPDVDEIVRLIVEWRDVARWHGPAGPRDAASLAPLTAVAHARRELLHAIDRPGVEALRRAGRLAEAWQAAGLRAAFDPARPEGAGVVLTAGARAQLQADLAALLPVHLLWHIPRDERGRLALGETVLLAPYESAVPLGKGRQLWLAAVAPARRREPQVVTLRLEPLIGENHTHVWTEARWLWEARAQATSRLQRWGVGDLPLAELGLDAWQAGSGRWSSAAMDSAAPEERAATGILLQDAGRLREALALFDVELAPEVERLVEGQPLGYGFRRHAAPWARTVQAALRDCAAWRFEPLLREAAAARERWVAEKRARTWTAPTLRLFWLPHQPQQSKAAVVLRARHRDGGRPRLELDWSASNARLSMVAWRRPLEIDLLRFGLLVPEEVL